MNNDVKKISLWCPLWEYKKIIEICNEQSKKGFHLSKIRILRKSIFKKDENKRYMYDVDFNALILKKGAKRDEYLEMFSEQGWEFVNNTFNGASLFRKEYKEGLSEDDYKIYTDRDSINELYNRMEGLLKRLLLTIIPLEFILMATGSALVSIGEDFSILEFLKMAGICVFIGCVPLAIFLVYGISKIRKL